MADGGDGTILHFPAPEMAIEDEIYAKPEPPKQPSQSAVILAEAISLVEGDRAVQHGDKLSLHRTMADLFTAYLRAVGLPLNPKDAAMLEMLMKAARTCHGKYNRDDYRDGAAYFAFGGEFDAT